MDLEEVLLLVTLFYLSGALVLALTNILIAFFSVNRVLLPWGRYWGLLTIAYGFLYLAIFYDAEGLYGMFYWLLLFSALVKVTAVSKLLSIDIPHQGAVYKLLLVIVLFISMFIPMPTSIRLIIFIIPGLLIYIWAGYVFFKHAFWVYRLVGILAILLAMNTAVSPWLFDNDFYVLFGYIGFGFIGLFYGLAIIGVYLKQVLDIQETMREELYYLSYHDALTGLNNRAYFDQQIAELEAVDHPIAMIVLDLNNLKRVNDSYGHRKGDQLIQKLADTLKELTDDTMIVVRYGGDEFVVMMQAELDNVKAFTKQLRRTFDKTSIDNIPLDVAIGRAHREDCSINLDTLFEQAEKAMYANKKQNRDD